jgi:hypothetical protein
MNPIPETIEKAILDIQILAGNLNQTNTDKLNSDLWNLESKISADIYPEPCWVEGVG